MSSNPILMALGRLEDAVLRLEYAMERRPAAADAAPLPDESEPAASASLASVGAEELARLRAENAELAVAADTVSSRLDKTIERLKTVLDA